MPAPIYNPPTGNNVIGNFTNSPAYVAPAGNNVVANFSNATTGRRKQILSS